METAAPVIKEVMREYEEKNNEGKEEQMIFGNIAEEDTRMLGCWMGNKEDLKQRRARAGRTWFKVKKQLTRSRLTKPTQARIVQACVENALLFDCHTRMWFKKDMKSLQSWVDRCYRHVWANRTGPPLRQMQAQGKNMQDVRNQLGIMTLQWKIEKRTLERIGHVLRMPDSRMVKVATLGWLEELESWAKTPGKKRKTPHYWKRLLREAAIDPSDAGRLAQDREQWRDLVRRRMDHLKTYEQQKGHHYNFARGERLLERNAGRIEEEHQAFECEYPGCGKVCLSKAGLTIHKRRMHEAPRKTFRCDKCNKFFPAECNMLNHAKNCGGQAQNPDLSRCASCGGEFSKTNIARHRRTCEARAGIAGRNEEAREARGERPAANPPARVYVPRLGECPSCGRLLSKTNMARHLRSCGGRM